MLKIRMSIDLSYFNTVNVYSLIQSSYATLINIASHLAKL